MPKKKTESGATNSKSSCQPLKSTTEKNNEDDLYDKEVDIVLVGDKEVGKTSLLFRFTNDMYTETYIPSVGMDYRVKLIETHGGKRAKLKLWDISGDIRSMEDIAKTLFRFASGFLVVYDVTNIESYNNVYHWMELLDKYALDKAQIVIVGNKTDLKDQVQISKDEGAHVAFCYQAKFMETSVYQNRNISKLFKRMISNICDG